MPNHDLLTGVEAHKFLVTGELPENFRERVKNLVEFYECPNCHGVRDMNIVLRYFYEDDPAWCPFCCDANGRSVGRMDPAEDTAPDAAEYWEGYPEHLAPGAIKQADPELERLLAEEEEIERRTTAQQSRKSFGGWL